MIELLKALLEITQDLDEKRGCLPADRRIWVKSYSQWNIIVDFFGYELATELLLSIDSDEYCVPIDTFKRMIKMVKDIDIELDELVKVLGYEHTPHTMQIIEDILYPNEPCLMIYGINGYVRGTRQECIDYTLEWEGDAYNDCKNELDPPLTFEEWAEAEVDNYAKYWDGDLTIRKAY